MAVLVGRGRQKREKETRFSRTVGLSDGRTVRRSDGREVRGAGFVPFYIVICAVVRAAAGVKDASLISAPYWPGPQMKPFVDVGNRKSPLAPVVSAVDNTPPPTVRASISAAIGRGCDCQSFLGFEIREKACLRKHL